MGIVHGDLKPANFLLSDVRLLTIKIADFGMSKLVTSNGSIMSESSLGQSVLQRTGGVKGTPIYCAPEMLVPAEEDSLVMTHPSYTPIIPVITPLLLIYL